jgi:hypothetical protein
MTSPVAETKGCPFCGGELLAKALQCRHCRRWLPEALRPAEAAPVAADGTDPPAYSKGQAPVHLVLLSVLTLGLYEVYWFFRNWRDLREAVGVDLSPGWRTVGLLIPVVNVVMVHHQLMLIRDAADARGVKVSYSPGIMTALFFGLALAGNLTLIWALSLLNVLPLVPVQETLNRLWAHEQPGAPVRDRFVSYEMAAMLAGAVATATALLVTIG